MSDIMFDCPECGGSLEVDAAGAGMTVNCPQCSKPILIPQPVTSARLKLSLDDQLAWWRMAPSLKLDIDTKLRRGERLNMDEVLSSKPVAPNLSPLPKLREFNVGEYAASVQTQHIATISQTLEEVLRIMKGFHLVLVVWLGLILLAVLFWLCRAIVLR